MCQIRSCAALYELIYSLTVGGGFGFLTGRHGLTIDNLIGATVVLANGEIVQATDKENPDVSPAVLHSLMTLFIPSCSSVFGAADPTLV